jgi:hypothetical protein
MILNAVSRGLRLARSSQALLVAMLSPVQSSAAPLALFATNSHASAAKAHTPFIGVRLQIDRRSGLHLSGGFAL